MEAYQEHCIVISSSAGVSQVVKQCLAGTKQTEVRHGFSGTASGGAPLIRVNLGRECSGLGAAAVPRSSLQESSAGWTESGQSAQSVRRSQLIMSLFSANRRTIRRRLSPFRRLANDLDSGESRRDDQVRVRRSRSPALLSLMHFFDSAALEWG